MNNLSNLDKLFFLSHKLQFCPFCKEGRLDKFININTHVDFEPNHFTDGMWEFDPRIKQFKWITQIKTPQNHILIDYPIIKNLNDVINICTFVNKFADVSSIILNTECENECGFIHRCFLQWDKLIMDCNYEHLYWSNVNIYNFYNTRTTDININSQLTTQHILFKNLFRYNHIIKYVNKLLLLS